jgi:hypothetical protein
VKQLHFIIGLATAVHFAITGAMMRTDFFRIDPSDTLVRMMLRSNHIYILFSALLNLVVYLVYRFSRRQSAVLAFSSALIMLSAIGLSIAFYLDPLTHSLQRDLTRYSIYSSFAGVVVLMVYFVSKRENGS